MLFCSFCVSFYARVCYNNILFEKQACTASGQWLTTANPRDSYDPQYSLYALWDPADFLADGQPAAWVTMYATE